MYSIERKMLIFKIVWNSTSYAMDGMCYPCIIKFLYVTLPVPNPPNGWFWVHHNVCNWMEYAKHSIVKLPYLFSNYNMHIWDKFACQDYIRNYTVP